MEIVTSWMEEGMQKGLQRGQAQGRQAGMEAPIQRLMQRRFSPAFPEMDGRVRKLNESQLCDLGEALLDFASVGDLERWLSQAGI